MPRPQRRNDGDPVGDGLGGRAVGEAALAVRAAQRRVREWLVTVLGKHEQRAWPVGGLLGVRVGVRARVRVRVRGRV